MRICDNPVKDLSGDLADKYRNHDWTKSRSYILARERNRAKGHRNQPETGKSRKVLGAAFLAASLFGTAALWASFRPSSSGFTENAVDKIATYFIRGAWNIPTPRPD